LRAGWKADLIGRTEAAILEGEDAFEGLRRARARERFRDDGRGRGKRREGEDEGWDEECFGRENRGFAEDGRGPWGGGLREGWTVLAGYETAKRRGPGVEWVWGCGPRSPSPVSSRSSMRYKEEEILAEREELENLLDKLRSFRRRLDRWKPMSFWEGHVPVAGAVAREYEMEDDYGGGGGGGRERERDRDRRRERSRKRASFASGLVARDDGDGNRRWKDYYEDDALAEEKRAAQRAWRERMEREGRFGERETFYPPLEKKIRLEEILYWPRSENDFD
jgi:hypothetical protein